ncbi:MAG: hypothetical protein AB8G26_18990 [Ilumatobacter sp.]
MMRGPAAAVCVAATVLAACGGSDSAAVPAATSIENSVAPAADPVVAVDDDAESGLEDRETPLADPAVPESVGDLTVRVVVDAAARAGAQVVADELASLGVTLEVVDSGATDIDAFIAAGPDVGLLAADAAAAGVPIVVTQAGLDIVPGDATRIEMATSSALLFDAVAARVALGEYQTIMVLGSPDVPVRPSAVGSLEARGAVVVEVDLDDSDPDSIDTAVEQVRDAGDGAAVIVAASGEATDLVAAVVGQVPESTTFTGAAAVPDAAIFSGTRLVVVGPTPPPDAIATTDATVISQAVARDATVLAAVVAVASGSADPLGAWVSASRDGESCTSAVACIELARNGIDVDVDGGSGPLDLGDDGRLRAAWVAIESLMTGDVDVVLHRAGG